MMNTTREQLERERAELRKQEDVDLNLEHPCDTCPNYYPDDDDCGYCEKLEAYWDSVNP